MSEGYLAQRPVAIWNSARGVWEKPETVSLLCEHLELYSETWQTSGMMLDGQVFELQMPVHHINDSESLLLRTPAASEAERGHQPEDKARARGGQVTLSGQLNYLPTPVTTDYNTAASDWGVKGFQQLRDLHNLLPTPNTMDDLPARDESKIDRSKGGFSNVRETVVRSNFDRFEPAVKRWEQVTGMDAPAPTKPDGKDGDHRLSSEFTEWMMGLRPGWVTGHGLSRKDELRACGNGVVPQQAELALRLLLEVHDV
jgi:hypothetical protein